MSLATITLIKMTYKALGDAKYTVTITAMVDYNIYAFCILDRHSLKRKMATDLDNFLEANINT